MSLLMKETDLYTSTQTLMLVPMHSLKKIDRKTCIICFDIIIIL